MKDTCIKLKVRKGSVDYDVLRCGRMHLCVYIYVCVLGVYMNEQGAEDEGDIEGGDGEGLDVGVVEGKDGKG